MSRSESRVAAFRFCLTTLLVLGTLFGWVAVLTFNVADPPSTSVYRMPTEPLQNRCGPVGAWVAYQTFYYLGIGTYALLAMLTVGTIAYCRDARFPDPALRSAGLLLICAAVSAGGAMFIDVSDQYLMSGPGGVLGTATSQFLVPKLETAGTSILLLCALVVGLLLAADDLILRLVRGTRHAARQTVPVVTAGGAVLGSAGAAVAGAVATVAGGLGQRGDSLKVDPKKPAPSARRNGKAKQLSLDLAEEEQTDNETVDADADAGEEEYEYVYEEVDEEEPEEDADAEEEELVDEEEGDEEAADEEETSPVPRVTALAARRPAKPEAPTFHQPPGQDGYELPKLELLEEAEDTDTSAIEQRCREKALILEQTLNEFRLQVQIVAIETGPVITVFELKLAPGIKVSQISSLTNDMARALGAPAVRVVAPLPGKNTIGIEVPNLDKEKVRIKDVISQASARVAKQQIPLFLGKDASGQPLVTDLTRMPHLLIAGTTGSGKSVCISSIVMSILLTRSPSEVNVILVDPKVVELTMFKDVPHLMCPIVSDMAKAEAILDWASTKMDERYALLAEAGVKDIGGYNRLGAEGLRERFEPTTDEEMQRIPTKLPFIVIIIDELADLMMTSAKEVEFHLCRIAQKSRAVGIHLIVSTQRPSANVVTGLIKSNLPSRIAFRVASRLDSRIVLDQNGGEVLMGQGDMLFLPPGSSKLMRAQGTFIDDDELRQTVKHCASQCKQSFHPELMREPSVSDGTTERDELFDSAVEIILQSKRGSVSLLQRRLTIGYSRASRLIEQMYQAGIVGEYKGSQAREVLITADEWKAARNQRDREEAAEAADVLADGGE